MERLYRLCDALIGKTYVKTLMYYLFYVGTLDIMFFTG